ARKKIETRLFYAFPEETGIRARRTEENMQHVKTGLENSEARHTSLSWKSTKKNFFLYFSPFSGCASTLRRFVCRILILLLPFEVGCLFLNFCLFYYKRRARWCDRGHQRTRLSD
ncbi:MAG: hypothetical protein RLZ12_1017, partial [Bacillota bacterium]